MVATAVIAGLALSLAAVGTSGQREIQPNIIQFRAHPERCVEMVDAGAESGSLIQLADCEDQATHQSWLWDDVNWVVRSAVYSSKCLDISGGVANLGLFLQVWDCYSGDGQMWAYDEEPGRLYHCTDGDCDGDVFCVDVAQDIVGSQIQLWNCDDKPAQSWTLGPSSLPPVPVPDLPDPEPPKKIQSLASGRCLDVPGGTATNGQTLWMWDCLDVESQNWAWDENNMIVYLPEPSKCVDLLGGDFTNGASLGIWECTGAESQQWGFSDAGTIYLVNDPTKCVQTSGENTGNLYIWDCESSGIGGDWGNHLKQIWRVGYQPLTKAGPEPIPEPSSTPDPTPVLAPELVRAVFFA